MAKFDRMWVVNEGRDSEQRVEGTYYSYEADNKFITFYREVHGEFVPVLTVRSDHVESIRVLEDSS